MKYLYIIRISILELLEYKANIPVRSLAYVLNIGLNLLLWMAIVRVKGSIFGYDTHEILLYYLFLFALLPLVVSGTDFAEVIGKDIKEGDLVKVLIKPVSPVFYYATVGIAQRLKDFLSLSPIIILIMLSIGLPSSFSFAVILKIALAAFVALVIDHTLMGTIGLVAFWTTQIIWLSNFIRQIFNLISGARFPVNFFPIILVTFLSFTPLYFLAYFPAAIFLGKLGDSIGREFIIGIFWTVALTTLYLALWKRGLKRYEGSSQ